MKRLYPCRAKMLVLTALAGILAAGWPVHAQEAPAVYEMIPGDAQVALVVPDLEKFSRAMRMLNKDMGLDNPGFNDVLDEFRRTSGMNKGINDKGGLIVAIIEMRGLSEARQPQTVMLVPISDYADFVGNFDGSARAPVTTLQMGWGQSVFCKQSGDHAVLSSDKSLVEKYRPGSGRIRVDAVKGTLAAEYLDRGNAAILFDSRAGGPALLELYDGMMDAMKDSIAKALPSMKALVAPTVDSFGGLIRDGIELTVRDAEVSGITLDITRAGIAVTAVARFKSGSSLGKYFTAANSTPLIGLNRLPKNNFITASTADLRGVDVQDAMTKLQSTLKDRNLAALAQSVEQSGKLLSKIDGISHVRYTPEQLSFTSQMGEAIVIEVKDGRGFVAAFRSHVDGLDGTTMDLGQWPGPSGKIDPDQPPLQIRVNSQYTAGAQRIESTRADQYLIERSYPPQLSATMGPMFGWIMMLRGREQKGYIAAVDDAVVLTTNDDIQLLRKMVLGVRQTTGLGTRKLIRQSQQNLPANSQFQWYLNCNDLAEMFNQAVKTMEWDFDKIDLSEPLPPIAFGVAADSKSIAKRLHLPMITLKALREPILMITDILTEEDEQAQLAQGRDGFGPGGQGVRGGPGGPGGRGGGGGPFGPGGGGGPFGPGGGGGGRNNPGQGFRR